MMQKPGSIDKVIYQKRPQTPMIAGVKKALLVHVPVAARSAVIHEVSRVIDLYSRKHDCVKNFEAYHGMIKCEGKVILKGAGIIGCYVMSSTVCKAHRTAS